MSNLDKIKEKIAALLAKAEGTDNAAEAETFMEGVNRLLEKYQIEMHEIRAMQADQDPMGKQKGDTNIYASMLWARNLGDALARYYNCRMVYWKKKNHFTYEIIGRESARMTYEIMFPFIISQVRIQAKRLCVGSDNAASKSVMEREVGQALMIRIHKLAAAATAHRVELTGKGLIPISDVDAAVAEFYPKVKEAKGKKVTFSIDAWNAAQRVSLNTQTQHDRKKMIA